MRAYRVRYEIDIDADSPEHAAKDAVRFMTEPGEERVSYVFDMNERNILSTDYCWPTACLSLR